MLEPVLYPAVLKQPAELRTRRNSEHLIGTTQSIAFKPPRETTQKIKARRKNTLFFLHNIVFVIPLSRRFSVLTHIAFKTCISIYYQYSNVTFNIRTNKYWVRMDQKLQCTDDIAVECHLK